jgi:hypothetical protein
VTDLTPEAVKAALDGATKGKRVQFHPDYCDEAKGSDWKTWDTSHDTSVILRDGKRYKGYSHHKHAADATLDNIAPDLARDWLRLMEENKKLRAECSELWSARLNPYEQPQVQTAAGFDLSDLIEFHSEVRAAIDRAAVEGK